MEDILVNLICLYSLVVSYLVIQQNYKNINYLFCINISVPVLIISLYILRIKRHLSLKQKEEPLLISYDIV